ncbi:hypothetical protein AMTR_s00063p00141290 [Amborella trichopoda]|uniref:Uncharacterized protein n=1 Tax=Amborella trichopoda TaxID=13333 RepID=U5D7B3_AMBTC|nr:hypothetical protein AMTR_s00063p00141290 [Amborella trichopoda]
MGADFEVPIRVILEDMKVKEKRMKKIAEETEKAGKTKVESTPSKKQVNSKKEKESAKPARSSTCIAARFGGSGVSSAQAINMEELAFVDLSSGRSSSKSLSSDAEDVAMQKALMLKKIYFGPCVEGTSSSSNPLFK